MRRYQIDEIVYQQLDAWLGTRRAATLKFLNPLQFAVDAGVDSDLAMKVFALCTYSDIGLLRVRYQVECEACKKILATLYNSEEIPNVLECTDCSHVNKHVMHDISVYFELMQEPQRNFQTERQFPLGKAPCLKGADLAKSTDPAILGLISKFDERDRCSK